MRAMTAWIKAMAVNVWLDTNLAVALSGHKLDQTLAGMDKQ